MFYLDLQTHRFTGTWEPQCVSLLTISVIVFTHQLLSLKTRLVTLSSEDRCPAHSNWLDSKPILTDSAPARQTQSFILWSHRSSSRAFRKCPTMLGKFVWQVSDPTLIIHCQPHASTVQKNTSHHAQKGFSYALLFLAVSSTGVEREWDVTIYILPSAGIHTRHIVIVNTCVTMWKDVRCIHTYQIVSIPWDGLSSYGEACPNGRPLKYNKPCSVRWKFTVKTYREV